MPHQSPLPLASRRTALQAGAALAAATGLVALGGAPARAAGSTYYVASDGDDAAAGTSESAPWKSLEKASSVVLAPGDALRFRCGDTFTGALALQGSGSAEAPISVGSYGAGARPVLAGAGAVPATVHLTSSSHLQVSDLEITNTADSPAYRSGILIEAPEAGLTGISLRRLSIHDITGDPYTGQGDFPPGACGGISVTGEGEKLVDSLLIQDVTIANVDDHGIRTTATTQSARGTDYTFRYVDVTNAGGNGMVIANVSGALVEGCTVRDSGTRSTACAGIWPVYSEDVTIQNNGVWGQTTLSNDGFSYNCDWQNTDALFQYNFSHGSEMGFFQSFFQSTATVRYNISQDDASGFALYGASDLRIYHNTVHLREGTDGAVMNSFENQGRTPANNILSNNLLVHNGTGEYASLGVSYSHNLFDGHHPGSEPTGDGTVTGDPLLVAPSEGDSWVADGFRLRSGSPALGGGTVIAGNGGQDYYSQPVSATEAPNIGAYAGTGG